MMGVNKGFVAMMPLDKPEEIQEEVSYIVDNKIKFTLFNKEFSFTVQIRSKQE